METRFSCWLSLLVCCLCLQMSSAAAPVDGRDISIESPATLVKGFPWVLRVTVTGPQEIPKLSLFEELAQVTVKLTSKENHEEFVISSPSPGMAMTVTTPEGARIDSVARRMFLTCLKRGEKRSMLLDLWSLLPYANGTALNHVPAGKYGLAVSFPSSGKESNSIDVEILEPTGGERSFLATIRRKGLLCRGVGVNWSRFLRGHFKLPNEGGFELRKEASEQLRFHDLVSRILVIGTPSRQAVKGFRVPQYLSAEKECLLIELDIVTGEKTANEERDVLIRRHIDLRWRLERASAGDSVVLRHRGPGNG